MNYEVANYRLEFSKDWKYLCVLRMSDGRIMTCVPVPASSYLTVEVSNNQYEIAPAATLFADYFREDLTVFNEPSGSGRGFAFNGSNGIGIGDLRDCLQSPQYNFTRWQIFLHRHEVAFKRRTNRNQIFIYAKRGFSSQGLPYSDYSCYADHPGW